MKFGRTLSDRIPDEFAPYSVDYKGMKKALKGKVAPYARKIAQPEEVDRPTDVEAVAAPAVSFDINIDAGDDCGYDETVVDHDAFFILYDRSRLRLARFYGERSTRAFCRTDEVGDRIERCLKTPSFDAGSVADRPIPSDLRSEAYSLSHEIGGLIDFVELNHTGFSKILKKYDKRTGGTVRESYMTALREDYSFMDGAPELVALRERLNGMIDALDRRWPHSPLSPPTMTTACSLGDREGREPNKECGCNGENCEHDYDQSRRRASSSSAPPPRRFRADPLQQKKTTRDMVQMEKAMEYLKAASRGSSFFGNNNARPVPVFEQEGQLWDFHSSPLALTVLSS